MSDLLQAIELYLGKVTSNKLNPSIVIGFSISLCIMIGVRFIIALVIEHRKPKLLRYSNLYLGYHVLTELVIAYILSYILIKITDGKLENVLLNLVVAPGISMIAAFLFDKKIFIPFEESNNAGLEKKGKKDKKKEDDGSNVTINIHNGNPNTSQSGVDLEHSDIKVKHLEEEDVYKEEFGSVLAELLNTIQERQVKHDEQIKNTAKKMDETISILNLLKESEMLNKKIELKRIMYNCLAKGYATPEENDKVVTYYKSYTDLGGNHEVQSLYENHYVRLKIRTSTEEDINNDNRNNTMNIDDMKLTDVKLIDILQPQVKKQQSSNCIYGMYDGSDSSSFNLNDNFEEDKD